MKNNALLTLFIVFVLSVSADAVSAYTLLWDDYVRGTGVVDARANPNNALHTDGAADDYQNPTVVNADFLSLGLGGSVVLYLANNEAIKNVAGDDFTVFETTGGADAANYNPSVYPEYAEIFAFTGGIYNSGADYSSSIYWQSLGTILQNGSLDLGSLLYTTAIKIKDVTKRGGPSGDGFDVYGLGIKEVTSVPVPAAVWMLGTGLVALVGVRRKLR